jgi:hypothetical protein
VGWIAPRARSWARSHAVVGDTLSWVPFEKHQNLRRLRCSGDITQMMKAFDRSAFAGRTQSLSCAWRTSRFVPRSISAKGRPGSLGARGGRGGERSPMLSALEHGAALRRVPSVLGDSQVSGAQPPSDICFAARLLFAAHAHTPLQQVDSNISFWRASRQATRHL